MEHLFWVGIIIKFNEEQDKFIRAFFRSLLIASSAGSIPLIDPSLVIDDRSRVRGLFVLYGLKIWSKDSLLSPYKYFGLASVIAHHRKTRLFIKSETENILDNLPSNILSNVSYRYICIRSEVYEDIALKHISRAHLAVKKNKYFVKCGYSSTGFSEINCVIPLDDIIYLEFNHYTPIYEAIVYLVGLSLAALLSSYHRYGFALRQIATQSLLYVSKIKNLLGDEKAQKLILDAISRLMSLIIIEYYLHCPMVLRVLKMAFSAELTYAIAHRILAEEHELPSWVTTKRVYGSLACKIRKYMENDPLRIEHLIKIIIGELSLQKTGFEALVGRLGRFISAINKLKKIKSDNIIIFLMLTEQSNILDLKLLMETLNGKDNIEKIVIIYTPQTYINRIIIEDMLDNSALNIGDKVDYIVYPPDRPMLTRKLIQNYVEKLNDTSSRIVLIGQGLTSSIFTIALGLIDKLGDRVEVIIV